MCEKTAKWRRVVRLHTKVTVRETQVRCESIEINWPIDGERIYISHTLARTIWEQSENTPVSPGWPSHTPADRWDLSPGWASSAAAPTERNTHSHVRYSQIKIKPLYFSFHLLDHNEENQTHKNNKNTKITNIYISLKCHILINTILVF